MTLQSMLTQPTRSAQVRVQALLYLAAVLGRYHRYADAIVVQDYLLTEVDLDPGTVYALKLGKTMGVLHQDLLSDAHQALGELRRVEGSGQSAGLALNSRPKVKVSRLESR